MNTQASPRKPSALYRLSRSWHEWLGLISSVLICLVSLTGIYLNHRDLFSPSPAQAQGSTRPEGGPRPEGARRPDGSGRPGGGRPGGPVKLTPKMLEETQSFPRAMAQITQEWGSEAPVESIMLRRDGRGLVWRIKSAQGHEIHLDARSLAVLTRIQPDGKGANSFNRIIHNLHTGQIVGMPGKIIMDLVALGLVVLSVTGVILWIKPRLVRRRRTAAQVCAS